jgi:hypothetical protein
MDIINMDTNMGMESVPQDTSFENTTKALEAMQLVELEPTTNMSMEAGTGPRPCAPAPGALEKIKELFQNRIDGTTTILVSIDIVTMLHGEHGDEVDLLTITALDTSVLGYPDSPHLDDVWTDIAIDVHNQERELVFQSDGTFRRTGDRKWGGRHDELLEALQRGYEEGRKIVLVGSDVVARCFLPGIRSDMFCSYQEVLNKLFWISDCVLELSHPGTYHGNFSGQASEESSFLLRLAGKALSNERFEEMENMFINTFTSRVIAQKKPDISDLALALRLGTEGEWDIMLDRESLEVDMEMQGVNADMEQVDVDHERQDCSGADCVRASCAMESLVIPFATWMQVPHMR